MAPQHDLLTPIRSASVQAVAEAAASGERQAAQAPTHFGSCFLTAPEGGTAQTDEEADSPVVAADVVEVQIAGAEGDAGTAFDVAVAATGRERHHSSPMQTEGTLRLGHAGT
jgi:hypothetical protein